MRYQNQNEDDVVSLTGCIGPFGVMQHMLMPYTSHRRQVITAWNRFDLLNDGSVPLKIKLRVSSRVGGSCTGKRVTMISNEELMVYSTHAFKE